MPSRYKITLQSDSYTVGLGYKQYDYTVCTCLDERKAIVMATLVFKQDHPEERIYQVLQLEKLEGDEALPTDISDRLEY
jgi:hypothetical protein